MRKLCIPVLVFILTTVPASGIECPSPPWQVNRVRPLQSLNSTLSARIDNVPAEKKLLRHLLGYYSRLAQRSNHWECITQPTLGNDIDSVKRLMSHLGYGEPLNCLTEIGDKDRFDQFNSSLNSNIYDSIVKFNQVFRSHAPAVLRDYGIDWKENSIALSELLDGVSLLGYRKCSLAKSLAYRFEGAWGLLALFTNISNNIDAKAFKRGYFMETISLGTDGHVLPHNFSIPSCKTIQNEPVKMNLTGFENGTASFATWGGKPTWSHFEPRDFWSNSAVDAAILRGEHQKDLVEDSGTASNLAVLIFPAVLALVPLGLFQDVSLLLTLLYTLVTDIVSVLPVSIKGAELILYASKEHTAMTSHLYAMQRTWPLWRPG